MVYLGATVHVLGLRQIPEERIGPRPAGEDTHDHAVRAALEPIPVEVAVAREGVPIVGIPDVIAQGEIDRDRWAALEANALTGGIEGDVERTSVA